MQLTTTQCRQLSAILKRPRHVLAAYLFGSQVHGITGPMSDIDIGLVLHPTLTSAQRARIINELFTHCAQRLETDSIDLIDLRSTSVLLCYRVMTEGVPLFVKNPKAVLAFQFKAVQDYEDFRPHLETQSRLIQKKIASYVTD